MPDPLGAAMERTVSCFAQNPKMRQALTDDLMFELGGSREQLKAKMQLESSEARERLSPPVAARKP